MANPVEKTATVKVRLVKGAYDEKESIAYRDRREVDVTPGDPEMEDWDRAIAAASP